MPLLSAPVTEWTVAPGYEPVRDAFLAGMDSFGVGGGAYCAYVDGEVVVDLWAGEAQPGQPWLAGTTTVIMSATKGFAVLCMQLLVDRGLIELDAPVATYWPEFAQNGKEGVLIRHVLSHTAGVIGYEKAYEVTRFDGTGWDDYDGIAAGLAAAAPAWEPGTKHGYHALTVGWLIGEIVRRVTGKSLGTFFREEIGDPLDLECWIGTPAQEMHRVARVHKTYTGHFPSFVRKTHEVMMRETLDPSTLIGKAFMGNGTTSGIHELESVFNNPTMLAAEFPAGGATCNARALARTWAMMAGGGALDGVRVLSPEIVEAWSRVVQNETDELMVDLPVPKLASALTKGKTPRTVGHLGNMAMPGIGARFGPNPKAYGAEGLGGQEGFCDVESGIAVGFVRSDLAMMDTFQPAVTNVLYECARKQGRSVFVPPAVPRWKAPAVRALGTFMRKRIGVPPVSARR
ncbi:MAG: beta-lactamase [Frankiales bacterium]|nr:beta-lactamase [Frankiales bacterium]